mgnify:CR=1 FL=1
MTPLHPHWDATDDAGSSEDYAAAGPVRVAIEGHAGAKSVSRRPAAIVGILLALSLGAVLVNSRSAPGLSADVSTGTGSVQTGIVITISEKGFEPPTMTVMPGDRITWKNTTQIPHVLSSETLRGSDGKPMALSPIFPSAQGSFDIPVSAAPSTYNYISETDKISGAIVVVTQSASSAQAASSAAQVQSSTPASTPAATVPATQDSGSQASSESPASVNQASLLPTNPHTVGSPGNVAPPAGQTSNKVPLMATVSKKGYKPYQTPAAGPTLWIVVSLSIGALFFVTRRSMKSIG